MTVQWMPKYYNKPRESRSEALLKSLQPLGEAAGGYLQSMVNSSMNKQRATGLAKALNHPEWAEALSGYEAPQQIALAKELTASAKSSSLSKMNLGGDISKLLQATGLGSNVTQPTPVSTGLGSNIAQPAPISAATPPPQEELKPTAPTTAAKLAETQRGVMPPGIPYSPEYVANQQAQERGAPAALAQISPEAQRPEGPAPKPILAGDLPEDVAQALRERLPEDAKEAFDKIRTNQIRTASSQRSAAAAERRATTSEKAQDLAERKFQSKEKQDLAKSKGLTKEDEGFVKDMHSSHKAVNTLRKAVEDMKAIRERQGVGWFTGITPEGREARAQYSVRTKDVLPLFGKMFPKGFTQNEFTTIQKLWIPHAGETESTIKGKEEGLLQMADSADQLYQDMRSLKNEDGSYPKNISSLAMEKMDSQLDNLKKNLLAGPDGTGGMITSGEYEKPPQASEVPPGYRMQIPNGEILVSDGQKWTKE